MQKTNVSDGTIKDYQGLREGCSSFVIDEDGGIKVESFVESARWENKGDEESKERD